MACSYASGEIARETTTCPFTILLTGRRRVAQPGPDPSPAHPTTTSSSAGADLEGDVPMLPGGVRVPLVAEEPERAAQAGARVARADDLVDVAELGRHVGAGGNVAGVRPGPGAR